MEASTPCRRCPKFNLYPKGWQTERGLHPANEFAVGLYRMCQEDQRVGVFDSAPLVRTLTLPSVQVILDEYDVHFPTFLDRQNTLEKILIMDRVATEVRGRAEERLRAARRQAQANQKPQSKQI